MNYTANDNLEVMKLAKNYNNFLANIVVRTIKNSNSKRILDFGCADGFFIQKLLKLCPFLDIVGIETDEDSLITCKKLNINVIDTLERVPNETIDIIYSFNVLEHIEDDEQILTTFKTKLIKNGKVIIYVPALMFLFSSMDTKAGHYRRYNKKELKLKLEKSGLHISRIEYCDCLGILATLLYKLKDFLLRNGNGDISPLGIVLYDKVFFLSRILDYLLFKYLCGKNIIVIANKK